MKKNWQAFSFVLVLLTAFGSAQPTSRIAYSSDRLGNRNIYKVKDDGTGHAQVTNESGEAHNPTITPGGTKVTYDVGYLLWMSDFITPIGTPVLLAGGLDPDAGPVINGDGDFRIIYQFGTGGVFEIWMATVDVSEEPATTRSP